MKNDKVLLKEDFIENALMVAGFVPVLGEIADIILIIRYLWQGKYLYAGLMLIALIPTVGDIIAKPFIFLLKSRRATNIALKNSDELFKYLEKNPQAKKIYSRLANHIDSPLIGKTINQVEKVPQIGPKAAEGMRESIRQHASVLGRIFNRPINIGKSIGKELTTNSGSFLKNITGRGPVAMGVKKYFRGQRLAKYLEKNGRVPSNWLSYWWNVVYKGSRDRKQYVRNFIMANNILDMFGLPSMSAFESKFENDANFREELANNDKFTELVGNVTTNHEMDIFNRESTLLSDTPKKSTFYSKALGLELIKKLAQGLV
jgi:hypothetical protein